MKVSRELLQKYASGNCSEEERKIIENWLPGEEDIADSMPETEWKDVSVQMWQNIVSETRQPAKRLDILKLSRYVTAACIILGLAYWGKAMLLNHSDTREEELDNTYGNRTRHITAAGFSLDVFPGSKVKITEGTYGFNTTIALCGELLLQNKQQENRVISLALSSACGTSNQTENPRQLKAGKKYVVLQVNGTGGKKNVVIEKRFVRVALADILPPVRYTKIINKLSI